MTETPYKIEWVELEPEPSTLDIGTVLDFINAYLAAKIDAGLTMAPKEDCDERD